MDAETIFILHNDLQFDYRCDAAAARGAQLSAAEDAECSAAEAADATLVHRFYITRERRYQNATILDGRRRSELSFFLFCRCCVALSPPSSVQ